MAKVTARPGAMSLYERYLLPTLVHRTCSSSNAAEQRAKLVPLARGEVLEVGFGSGLNLPFYDPVKVTKVWGLEPSEEMYRMASRVVRDAPFEVEGAGFSIVEMDAAYLPGWSIAGFQYRGTAVQG